MSPTIRNGLLVLLLILIGAFAFACFYVIGIPHPFCSYRTNVIDPIEKLPPEDELIAYFRREGWSVKQDNFEKQPKSLPHKEHILETQKSASSFLSETRVTVYIAAMRPNADVDYEGQIQIFVEQGNRLANYAIYKEIIDELNSAFELNIPSDGFNYMSYCN